MKILFIITSLGGGGAERVLSIIANELSRRQIAVTICTYYSSDTAYTLDKNIKLVPLFEEGEIQTNIFSKIIEKFKFFVRFRRLLKENDIDAVISFMKGMNGKAIIVSKSSNIPVVATEHTNHKCGMNLLSWVERRWLYKMADAVTVLTDYDYNEFYKGFLTNVTVMPNPVDFPPIKIMPERDKTILASGNLNRWLGKGFDNLLKIFSKVVEDHPDWKLKIAGSGDEGKRHLMLLSKKLNIQENVVFLGFCSNIKEELQRSSIFVLSSRYEGFPMVLIEAMSQGCACISFDCVSGPGEIIENEIDGILVEDQNMQQMEAEICRVIENEKLGEYLGKNAINNVQRFSTKTIVHKWLDLISNTISKTM